MQRINRFLATLWQSLPTTSTDWTAHDAMRLCSGRNRKEERPASPSRVARVNLREMGDTPYFFEPVLHDQPNPFHRELSW